MASFNIDIGVDKPIPHSNKTGLPLLQRIDDFKLFGYYPTLAFDRKYTTKLERFLRINMLPELKNQWFVETPNSLAIKDANPKSKNTGKSSLVHYLCHHLKRPTYRVRVDNLYSDSHTLTLDNLRRIVSFGLNCDTVIWFDSLGLLTAEMLNSLIWLIKSTKSTCIYILEDSSSSLTRDQISMLDMCYVLPYHVKGDTVVPYLVSLLDSMGFDSKTAEALTKRRYLKDNVTLEDLNAFGSDIIQECYLRGVKVLTLDCLKGLPCAEKVLKV